MYKCKKSYDGDVNMPRKGGKISSKNWCTCWGITQLLQARTYWPGTMNRKINTFSDIYLFSHWHCRTLHFLSCFKLMLSDRQVLSAWDLQASHIQIFRGPMSVLPNRQFGFMMRQCRFNPGGGKKGSKVFGSVHDPRAAEDIFRLVLEKKKYIVSPVVHLSSICIFLHV